MRVAFWRLRAMFERIGAKPTVAINAKICETYAPVVQACIDSGWELNAHSYEQIPMHKLEDQRTIIDKTMRVIEKFSGKRPRGWFGPGLTQTLDTVDHLAEAGVEYIGDYVLDDDPVTLKTKHGDIVALPYTFEVHDIVMMNLQHHASGGIPHPRHGSFQAACMRSRPSGRRSWPSPAIRICPACRTASPTWSAPSPTSSATTASSPGPASRSWTGTRRNECHAGTCSRHPSLGMLPSRQRVDAGDKHRDDGELAFGFAHGGET